MKETHGEKKEKTTRGAFEFHQLVSENPFVRISSVAFSFIHSFRPSSVARMKIWNDDEDNDQDDAGQVWPELDGESRNGAEVFTAK